MSGTTVRGLIDDRERAPALRQIAGRIGRAIARTRRTRSMPEALHC